MLNVQSTPLRGLYVIEPDPCHDLRGSERSGFHPTEYAAFGLTGRFSSDKFIRGFQGCLRGLYILPEGRNMLLTLIRGDITIVAVDTRPTSRQFGKMHMVDISDAHNHQIYIAGGLTYGVCVRGECADWNEKYATVMDDSFQEGIYWKDADLNINWPVRFPLVSERDATFPALTALVGNLESIKVR
jgi:dTDP-4-dehydrorhamnose 3,5-epimerase